MSLETVHYW